MPSDSAASICSCTRCCTFRRGPAATTPTGTRATAAGRPAGRAGRKPRWCGSRNRCPRSAATASDRPSPRRTRSDAPLPAAAACIPARGTPAASARGSPCRNRRRRNTPRQRETRPDRDSRGVWALLALARVFGQRALAAAKIQHRRLHQVLDAGQPQIDHLPSQVAFPAVRRSGSDCPRRCGAGSSRRRGPCCNFPAAPASGLSRETAGRSWCRSAVFLAESHARPKARHASLSADQVVGAFAIPVGAIGCPGRAGTGIKRGCESPTRSRP